MIQRLARSSLMCWLHLTMRSRCRPFFPAVQTFFRRPIVNHGVVTMISSYNSLFFASSHAFVPAKTTTTVFGHLSFYSSSGYEGAATNSDKNDSSDARMAAIHEYLIKLGIDAEKLSQAAIQSLQDPTTGPNAEFGISAIRAYRSFVFPKRRSLNDNTTTTTISETSSVALLAAASNCARQVEFLIKRHKSHQAEWVRHTDTALTTTTTTTNGELAAAASSTVRFPIIMMLDNVRSAFNVGSLFRTADACGCQLVVTTGITPHPLGNGADKLQKSALGAQHVVPHQHFPTTVQAIEHLRSNFPNYALLGMETTERSVMYTNLSYTKYQENGIVIILGNEVTGVDTDIMPLLDLVIEIPMFGSKNSLNIAACAPVVLYEILRQWEYSKSE